MNSTTFFKFVALAYLFLNFSIFLGSNATSGVFYFASFISRVCLVGLSFAVYSLLLFRPWIIRIMFKNWLVITILIWSMLSSLWSENSFITFVKTLELSCATLAAVYLAGTYSYPDFVKHLYKLSSIAVLLSLVFCILFPESRDSWGEASTDSFFDQELAWRGVFSHKNFLGHVCALNIVITTGHTFALITKPGRLFTAISALFLLYMSKSTTGMFCALLGICYFLVPTILTRLTGGKFIILTIISFCFLIYLAFTGHLNYFFTLIGKDPSLTGRAIIWSKSINPEPFRLFFGHGLGAFWGDVNIAPLQTFPGDRVAKFLAGANKLSAHNSFIQTLLDLGIIGLLILLGIIFRAAKNTGKKSSEKSKNISYAIVLFIIVLSFSESKLPVRNCWWIIINFFAIYQTNYIKQQHSKVT